MSQADTLIENLRKAKTDLLCAKEHAAKMEKACYDAQDDYRASREVYDKALAAIEASLSE